MRLLRALLTWRSRRAARRDARMLELLALIEECRRLQRPAMPPILRSALGVPYQLERRLLDELAALK